LPLEGDGAGKAKNQLAEEAAEHLSLRTDERLEYTDITEVVSAGAANMKLFLSELPDRTSPLSRKIRAVCRFTTLRDLISRYTGPLLNQPWLDSLNEYHLKLRKYREAVRTAASKGKISKRRPPKPPTTLRNRKDIREGAAVNGTIYPRWFVVPSMTSDTSDDGGGTVQGRITAKDPAIQTFPPPLEACVVSRWEGGAIIRADMAQIEYRVPAAYSWDESLQAIFEQGLNIHEQTASFMLGWEVSKKDHPKEYHLGKTGGFLVQFRGQIDKLLLTARRELGLQMEREKGREMMRRLLAARERLIAWQDELIETAKRNGMLEVPLVGISRTFLGTPATIDRTYVPTIVNFPVQTTAACVTLSAQITVERELRRRNLQTVLIYNTYDEGVYDAPPEEVPEVCEIIRSIYPNPPFWQDLQKAANLNPAVRLDCTVDVTYNATVAAATPRSSPNNPTIKESV
jgi:hypothetical protein